MTPPRSSPAAVLLDTLGWPSADPGTLPTSPARFGDGGQYRIEIPSVEGPRVPDAVASPAGVRTAPGVPVEAAEAAR